MKIRGDERKKQYLSDFLCFFYDQAYGRRLNVPSGSAVRFEPGDSKARALDQRDVSFSFFFRNAFFSCFKNFKMAPSCERAPFSGGVPCGDCWKEAGGPDLREKSIGRIRRFDQRGHSRRYVQILTNFPFLREVCLHFICFIYVAYIAFAQKDTRSRTLSLLKRLTSGDMRKTQGSGS